jgi:hypothetical protein
MRIPIIIFRGDLGRARQTLRTRNVLTEQKPRRYETKEEALVVLVKGEAFTELHPLVLWCFVLNPHCRPR